MHFPNGIPHLTDPKVTHNSNRTHVNAMAYSALYSDPLFKRMVRMVNAMHAEVSAIAANLADYERMHTRFAPRLLLGPPKATDYELMSPSDLGLDDTNTMSVISRELDSRWPMASSMFAADFLDEQGRYVVKVDVPGMTSADLKVVIENGRDLVISGERKSEYGGRSPALSPTPEDSADDDIAADKGGAKPGSSCMYERYFGSFSRTMRLPADIDMSSIDASVANGILTITIAKLPKAENEQQAHNVQVK